MYQYVILVSHVYHLCRVPKVFYLSSGNCVSDEDSDNPDKGVAQLVDIKVLTNILIKLSERFDLSSS